MNKYQMLPLPADTAWDRPKSLWGKFQSYFYNNHPKLYSFLDNYIFDPVDNIRVGLYNFRMWYKVIWNNRDWDYSFIYTILERKLSLQRKELVGANRHLNANNANFYITVMLNLIDKLQSGYYEGEYQKYHETKMNTEPYERNGKLHYKVNFEDVWEKYDDFLNKYPKTVKEVKLKYPEIDFSSKFRLSLYVAAYRHEKAKKTLMNILAHKIDSLWD